MAVDLMDMIKGAVTQQVMGKLGGALGMEPKKASSVFDMAAGSILGGLMKKASSPQGAQAVFEAAKKQDNGILDKLGDLMGGGQQTEQLQKSGGGILDMIMGGGQSGILSTLAKAAGVDQGVIGKLMAMVAPIVMAVIGKHMKTKALDAVGLGSLLGEQKSSLGNYMPASLTKDLGFGNLLSNASGAVSGAANNAANAGRSAANQAAKQGGGLMKLLVPLLLLAAVGFGIWKFVLPMLSGAADNAANTVNNAASTIGDKANQLKDAAGDAVGKVKIPGMDFGDLDISGLGEAGQTLQTGFGDIATGLSGLKAGDTAGANKLMETITGFTGKIDGLGLANLEGTAKTASGSMIGMFLEKVKGLLENVPGPLKAIIEPAMTKLTEKLSGFVG